MIRNASRNLTNASLLVLSNKISLALEEQTGYIVKPHSILQSIRDNKDQVQISGKSYDIGEIKDCALVTIPVYCYTFKPDGGLHAGGGHGVTFMAYDPNVVQIKTLLRLSTESKEGIYRAKE